MRLAIVGSRECGSHLKRTVEVLAMLRETRPTEVISGGAYGIDSIGAKAARALEIPVTEFLPDWKTHGRKAGFLRNKQIVEACDELHAWWDGKSRGTAHSSRASP